MESVRRILGGWCWYWLLKTSTTYMSLLQ